MTYTADDIPSTVTVATAAKYGYAYQAKTGYSTFCAPYEDGQRMFCGVALTPEAGRNIIVDGTSDSAIPHGFWRFNPQHDAVTLVLPKGTAVPEHGALLPNTIEPAQPYVEFQFNVLSDELAVSGRERVPAVDVLLHDSASDRLLTSLNVQSDVWRELRDSGLGYKEAELALLKELDVSVVHTKPSMEDDPLILPAPDWDFPLPA
ncbi:hypothetical protein [Rhodoligotrophos defluvii]|uniref:hypothetical protein n=1 Tax=Rhodoligotrophos defluvii TaxID=2561934 RepID=UPI0010C99CB1|nr:hypothetical protein [Rhodoligotrophos defluvii]